MSGNSVGRKFVLTAFGESHGRCVGAVVEGCPAGLHLDEEDIQAELNRRRPGTSVIVSPRAELDKVEIMSGLFEGRTTGAPICMIIWNRDVNSAPYESNRYKPRPGHADYPTWARYGGFNDFRGGGRFSGRTTASFVMAGAVAKKLLSTLKIEIVAYTVEIGGIRAKKIPEIKEIRELAEGNSVRCPDRIAAGLMERVVSEAQGKGDSVGGVAECVITNLPPGIGEPIFDSLDADLAKIIFDIPAVKGVEFGAGFRATKMKGSENNDPYTVKGNKITTLSNNAGGILGGLSNGMPLLLRVALKPTPSITLKQKTIDLQRMEETDIVISGRHDPCIVPRAIPVLESAVAITLVDHLLRRGFLPNVLEDLR
jgi:chorismate synthase